MAGLDSIDHVVLVMLENRSSDHMLGFLYPKSKRFEGLGGTESNLDAEGNEAKVFKITPDTQNAYYYPLANPAEGFKATNEQLFGAANPPRSGQANNSGFVKSFEQELEHPAHPNDPKLAGAEPASIMGMYAPETLPVLSGLARGFAVCDQWFASAPTETAPNRAFAVAGTALGQTDDSVYSFNIPTVFGKLAEVKKTWKIYGYSKTKSPLTADDFPDTVSGPYGEVVSGFARFQADAAAGKLANFSYIEPEWPQYPKHEHLPAEAYKAEVHNFRVQNDEHPISNMAIGEKFLYDIYKALHNSPKWDKTLLIITYDEHGGTYDHVQPPTGAVPPDNIVGPSGFDFTRFGVRVPAVIVSPLIEQGTILRAPAKEPPADGPPADRPPADGPPADRPHFDHTSIIATLRARFGIGALRDRDAKAPNVGSILTLTKPRTDDPLANVKLPKVAVPVLQAGSPHRGVRHRTS